MRRWTVGPPANLYPFCKTPCLLEKLDPGVPFLQTESGIFLSTAVTFQILVSRRLWNMMRRSET